ncbi:ABC-F family ATP-binding cassette domain-containing protein [bacterium]|nr:ABC-F family ATP-binding cassette domain-containing protein [bacterium]
MIVSRLDHVSRHYASETIFDDLCAQVESGERIGLVGPNGVGKTTLLKLLAGEDKPDTGQAYRHPTASVAYLKQFREASPGRTLMEEVRSGMSYLEGWYQEMVDAGQKMAHATNDEERRAAERVYSDRQDQLHAHGGFDFEHRVEEVLFGLAFKEEQFEREITSLSGGQQRRALLAGLLLQSPDLMLLDEPTNHLDITTTQWLEEYLARQKTAMIIVSHDRYFLDKTVTKIWELQGGKLTEYPGSYSQYVHLRKERQKVNERLAQRQETEIARLEDFVRRNKAGQLSKQAKSREKMIGKMAKNEIERIRDLDAPPIFFGEPSRSGDIVASARGLQKAFGANLLFDNVDLEIERGERIGMIGPNGAGKTTMLRVLLGEEPPTKGKVKLGHNVRVGYLRQEVDDLDPTDTCLDAVRPAWKPTEKEETFRGLLARFGIGADICEQKIRTLSGGQRTRVALARICAHEVNVLILDEPTNHLDLWAVQSLEEALVDYEGTVIVVSHDRSFLNTVCEKLLVLESQRIRQIPGNYDRYVETLRAEQAAAMQASAASAKPKSTPPPAGPKKKRKFPYRKAHEIEAEIGTTEKRLEELRQSTQDAAVYVDGKKLAAITDEMAQLERRLKGLMEHWEEALEFNT